MIWVIWVAIAGAIGFGAFYYWAEQRDVITGDREARPRRKRFSLMVEALGLVGAIMMLAGGCVAAAEWWQDITDWGHVAVFIAAAAISVVIGLDLRRSADKAISRVSGLTWIIATGCVTTATGITAHDVYGGAGAVTSLAAGLAITACSAVLWLAEHREWQLAALFGGVTVTVCGAILTATSTPATWLAVSLGLWALGVGWAIVGMAYPDPLWSTVPLSTALALIAPAFTVWGHGLVFVVGIVTAVAAMVASVPLRNTLLLPAGTLGLAGYVTALVARYYHALLGLPVTLAIAGVLLLGVALAAAWLRRALPPLQEKPPLAEVPTAARPRAEIPRGRPARPRLHLPRTS